MWPKNDAEIGHLLPLEYWIGVQSIWYTLKSKYIKEYEIKKNNILIIALWLNYHI